MAKMVKLKIINQFLIINMKYLIKISIGCYQLLYMKGRFKVGIIGLFVEEVMSFTYLMMIKYQKLIKYVIKMHIFCVIREKSKRMISRNRKLFKEIKEINIKLNKNNINNNKLCKNNQRRVKRIKIKKHNNDFICLNDFCYLIYYYNFVYYYNLSFLIIGFII